MKKYLGEIALVLVLAMIFLVPMSVALRAERYQQAEKERISAIKAAEQKQEQEALKAINAMMHNYPKRSETMAENEIPKIVRGTTGQAKLVKSECQASSGQWDIQLGSSTVAEGIIGDSNNGWFLGAGGVVSVPIDAQPGIYKGNYDTEDFDTCGGGVASVLEEYEFEVVCFRLEVGLVLRTIS